jgi:hypothetical protein
MILVALQSYDCSNPQAHFLPHINRRIVRAAKNLYRAASVIAPSRSPKLAALA